MSIAQSTVSETDSRLTHWTISKLISPIASFTLVAQSFNQWDREYITHNWRVDLSVGKLDIDCSIPASGTYSWSTYWAISELISPSASYAMVAQPIAQWD